jgi:enamine deaminase RidA (YjgF/YER057c/UK114 family)
MAGLSAWEARMRTRKINPATVAAPLGTYSHAVRVETDEVHWLFLSGQLAVDDHGDLVGTGDLRAQTEKVFENLSRVLEANGGGWEHVVKLQSFFTTLEDLAASREVRARYLPEEPPASTAVQVVALLLPGAMIEVDLVAAIPSR